MRSTNGPGYVMMSTTGLLPKSEDLRRAVRWISDHGDHSLRAVEEAALRFDLSPLDEQFLLRYLVEPRRSVDTPETRR